MLNGFAPKKGKDLVEAIWVVFHENIPLLIQLMLAFPASTELSGKDRVLSLQHTLSIIFKAKKLKKEKKRLHLLASILQEAW